MRQFRAAFVGTGVFAGDIMGSRANWKDIEIAGGCDSDPRAAEDFGRKYGVRAYGSLEEVLADGDIEGVLIVTPNDTHAALIEKAARAGKHIFVEKPISNSISEAKEAVKAAAEAGVTLFVGHVARRHSGVRLARKVIESGRCGTIMLVEGHTAHNGGLSLKPDEWRWYKQRCPGGPLIQLAVHTVDTLHYLVGPIKSVCAKVGRLATPAEIDDVGVIAIEFENGALGYVGTAYTIPSTNYLKVHGVGASVEITRGGEVIVRCADGKTESLSPAVTVDPIADELDAFASDARTGTRPETGGEEAIRALAVILAAVRSAEEGRTVTVAEILGD